MGLDEKFAPVRTAFYDKVGELFVKIASQFGYPDTTGMPTISKVLSEGQGKLAAIDSAILLANAASLYSSQQAAQVVPSKFVAKSGERDGSGAS